MRMKWDRKIKSCVITWRVSIVYDKKGFEYTLCWKQNIFFLFAYLKFSTYFFYLLLFPVLVLALIGLNTQWVKRNPTVNKITLSVRLFVSYTSCCIFNLSSRSFRMSCLNISNQLYLRYFSKCLVIT